MLDFDLLRVFVDRDGNGGNPLAVFLGGDAVDVQERQRVAAALGVNETVFVDDRDRAALRIFTPTSEVPFSGHPLVGAAWLLRASGFPTDVLRPPAGRVPTWQDEELTWIRAPLAWVPPYTTLELHSPAAVEAYRPPGDPAALVHVWAWEDRAHGVVRARVFAPAQGIVEDAATGSAALSLCAAAGRPVTVRQGAGSVIEARPGPDGSVDIGGRVALVAATDLDSFTRSAA